MSRKFYDKEVIIAINRSPYNAYTVPNLGTSLPVGSYTDVLTGELSGGAESVVNVSGNSEIASFQLSQQEVNVWSYNPDLGTSPRIGDIVSVAGRQGNEVTISGTGFDGTIEVFFGSTLASVSSSNDKEIKVIVPNAPAGEQLVTVKKNRV